jgi:hypothetical protein
MKTIKLKALALGVTALAFGKVNAQMSFNAQYLNRAEARHGYSTLPTDNFQTGAFISQRLRFGGMYTHEKFNINFSAQDVRTWGSVGNVAIDTKGLLSIYEANVDLLFNKKWSMKVGRQAISYDDDRIFGTLDWAMQGRRHDAAILKYKDSTWTVNTGFAYNQNGDISKYTNYNVAGNYQNFQFLWANKVVGKANFSFLGVNTGTLKGAGDSTIVYSQTLGLRGEYKGDKFNFLGYGYYQGGQLSTKYLNAYDVCAEVGYKPAKGFLATLGTEILSGSSQTKVSTTQNNSFNPLFGTNHRFNGYMDYFYVGNHVNSVGLVDGYLRLSYAKNKMLYSVNSHYFNAAADVKDKTVLTEVKKKDPYLGSELDFTLAYNYTEGVTIQAGYSQFFGTSTMQTLRGGSTAATANWGYVMLIVRPSKIAFPKVGLKM